MEQEIIERIQAQIPGSQVEVSIDGNRAVIGVTSESFASLSRVQKQQAVYACINEFIADGRLHAVTIRAQTPGD
jgi:acid stress-induced BolA-like protein IbaG/YrbA